MPQVRFSPSSEPSTETPTSRRWDYPVREYIAFMAAEMAEMARADGAEALGDLLDAAVRQAARA